MSPAGFEPRNPSKRSVADPRLRPLGHWHRPGFDPRTVQSVAIRYTDWAIAALVLWYRNIFFKYLTGLRTSSFVPRGGIRRVADRGRPTYMPRAGFEPAILVFEWITLRVRTFEPCAVTLWCRFRHWDVDGSSSGKDIKTFSAFTWHLRREFCSCHCAAGTSERARQWCKYNVQNIVSHSVATLSVSRILTRPSAGSTRVGSAQCRYPVGDITCIKW
jgi:hypothetical protein